MFLHAPHTGDVIKVSSLDEPYYQQQFAGGSDVSGSRPRRPAAGRGRAAGSRAASRPRSPRRRLRGRAATPDPGAADAGDSSDGGAADGLFGAIEESQKGGSHSTVQILPAVLTRTPNQTADPRDPVHVTRS
jgi:hypothetical protein